MAKRLNGRVAAVGLIGLVAVLLAVASSLCHSEDMTNSAGVIRHFVAFKFKDEVTPAERAEVNAALVALKDQIPLIVSVEAGANNSPEQKNQGFTDGFLITFRNAADRDAYLVHPAHQAFLKIALPRIEDAFVFDYATDAASKK